MADTAISIRTELGIDATLSSTFLASLTDAEYERLWADIGRVLRHALKAMSA